MEPSHLGVVVDSSTLITAERKRLSPSALVQQIRRVLGEVEVSLSPITVAELVHGIFRARSPERAQRRRAYIDELVNTVPVYPITVRTAFTVGQIHGEEAAKGNVLPFEDLLIAATAIEQEYALLTENVRHFQRIPRLTVVLF